LRESSQHFAALAEQGFPGRTPSLPSPLQGEGRSVVLTLTLPHKGGGNRRKGFAALAEPGFPRRTPSPPSPLERKGGSVLDAQAH
jgi:hypothetical protein